MNKNSKIYVAGHRGLVGSAIHRYLVKEGYTNILTRTSAQLDLRNQQAVQEFFKKEKPEYVFMAAAKVGGVMANKNQPADFIYSNLAIQTNVIHASHIFGVKKLLFLGSNCLYPENAEQPIKEDSLLTGTLEPNTEAYAIAKIAGIRMCQAYRKQYGSDFISVLPANMYGENDNYGEDSAHVMPSLLMKFKRAKEQNKDFVEVWGGGQARREFLYSDDLAEACLFLMLNYNQGKPINVGTGTDQTIKELAVLIKDISGYQGSLLFDTSKPEGSRGKLLDITKLRSLGWKHTVELEEGIKMVYDSLL